jgi:hypothetical protein
MTAMGGKPTSAEGKVSGVVEPQAVILGSEIKPPDSQS